MDLNEYQELSKRTMPEPCEVEPGYFVYWGEAKANYAMGLAGEAGETTDLIKKQLFHGHPTNKDAVKKELGDVLHYLAGLATMYGLTLEEVAKANIEKLMKRYPNGFNVADSLKRVDVNEKL